jgi:hypothetical protein
VFASPGTDPFVQALDAANARVGVAHRELLSAIAEVDRIEGWRDQGARDVAHWLAMRYGVSEWKARRWIAAAHALGMLPRVSEALERGELGIDKVLELARFATPRTEAGLVAWAVRVSVGAIRHRGDLEIRATREELVEVERDRSVSWLVVRRGPALRARGGAARRPGSGGRCGDRGPGAFDPRHAR